MAYLLICGALLSPFPRANRTKLCRVASLSILIIGLVIAPKATAQAVPTEKFSVSETAAVGPSLTPVFGYTRPTEKEKLRRLGKNVFGPASLAKVALLAG